MGTLFISDLHLDPARPDTLARLLALLRHPPGPVERLYILGDLFEAWIGDDAAPAELAPLEEALQRLKRTGTALYFQHGNRDFLLGEAYAERLGVQLLPGETVIDLYGRPALIMHGDSLCIDDHEYQRFRAMVRDPAWQARILALPIEQRLQLAAELRETSRAANQTKAEDIMDVNAGEVARIMEHHGVDLLIHGHTHRPAIHTLHHPSGPATRIVLGDWYRHRSSHLYWREDGTFHLHDPRIPPAA